MKFIYSFLILLLTASMTACKLYRKLLVTYPNRTQSILGLARAQLKSGHQKEAQLEYKKLKNQLAGSTSSSILKEAQLFS